MKNNKLIKIIALALASVMTVCSCGKYEEIPELKEPVTGIQTFRPVSKRNVGIPKTMAGCVSATEYCHFFKKPVSIKTINVQLGQYVEEGDVLCEADIDSVKTQIGEINNQIKLLETEHEQNSIIHDSTMKKLELAKEWAMYRKNLGEVEQKDVDAADKNIENEKENYDYDQKLYEFMKKSYQSNISDLNEIVEDGTLKAKKSGYVTYVKNLKNGNDAKVYENIVIIADNDDLYIKGNISTQSYQYSKYAAKFVIYKGETIAISEYEYTDAEKAYAKAQGMYPSIRFKPVEDIDLKAGDEYLMVFYKDYAENVLAIGKDSVQTDEDGTFVYVKADDGSLEKKYYEPGVFDEHYVEVKSGLEEGDKVLYEQTSQIPTDFETWEVTKSDYRYFNEVKGIKYEEKNADSYVSEDSGEVDTIYVDKGDEVKAGDPLMRIAIDSERGDNVKIQNDINHLKEAYENECKQYDKDLAEIEKQIHDKNDLIGKYTDSLNGVKNMIASGSLTDAELAQAGRDKAELEYTINCLYAMADPYMGYGTAALEEDKIILEAQRVISEKTYNVSLTSLQNRLSEQKKKNDGTGYKVITALNDGVVDTVKPSEGDSVDVGEKLIVVTDKFDRYITVNSDAVLPYGFETVFAGEDKDYKAEIVKGSWNSDINVFTENDKVYGTTTIQDKNYYVLSIDDDDFYKNMFDDYKGSVETQRYEDLFIVPTDYICIENDYEGIESQFVWKLEDNEPVKEYVVKENTVNVYALIQGVSEGDILVKQK